MSILDTQKGIPVTASARLQRWALMLPMPQSGPTPVPGDTIMLLVKMEEFPANVSRIRTWTNKDPLSSRVRKLIQCGFPEHLKSYKDLKPYMQRKFELGFQDQVLLWGNRAHTVIVRMKALARGLVWWPGIVQLLLKQDCIHGIGQRNHGLDSV